MDLGRVLSLTVLCWLSCVYGNQGTSSYFIAANSGESAVAKEYNAMHNFNFPDVTYPTSLLDTCQPFYFNSNSNGLDAIVGPFSSDVKSNYVSLLSCDNEKKVKDEVPLATKKCSLKDDIINCPLKNEDEVYEENTTKDTNKLENVIKKLKKFLEINEIDPELEEILSSLYSDEADESNVENYFDDNYNKNHNEIESISNLEDNVEEIMLQDMIENLSDLDSIDSDPDMDENEFTHVFQDDQNDININDSTTDEKIGTSIILNDKYEDLHSKMYDDVIIPKPTIEDINSNTNLELNTSEIQLDLELINGNISQHENKNIFDNDEQEIVIIKEDAEQLFPMPIITEYCNNFNIDINVNEPIELTLNNLDNELIMNDTNTQITNLNNFEDNELEHITYVDESTLIIPKEAVVFDVVSKDGLNLEKPLLDIVPSNLPVRLKINIEICKPDSLEKDDFTEIDDDLLTLQPIENNVDSQDLNNSIENIDEIESVSQDQITVLDEINDSDFISALSILLLDSLNNNPIEIIPPEIINAECEKSVDCPIQCKCEEKIDANKEKPPTVPDFIYSQKNLNKEANGHINSEDVKIIPVNPVINTAIPINYIPKPVDTGNIYEIPRMNILKDDIPKREETVKPEQFVPYPLMYYPANLPRVAPKLAEQNFYDQRNFLSSLR